MYWPAYSNTCVFVEFYVFKRSSHFRACELLYISRIDALTSTFNSEWGWLNVAFIYSLVPLFTCNGENKREKWEAPNVKRCKRRDDREIARELDEIVRWKLVHTEYSYWKKKNSLETSVMGVLLLLALIDALCGLTYCRKHIQYSSGFFSIGENSDLSPQHWFSCPVECKKRDNRSRTLATLFYRVCDPPGTALLSDFSPHFPRRYIYKFCCQSNKNDFRNRHTACASISLCIDF